MVSEFLNGDIIITDNKTKILQELKNTDKLLNVRLLTLKEFKESYFGKYDERAIYFLVKKYGYKYDVAKMYLDNFLFIPDLKKELLENNLIINEPLFKESIQRIVIVTPFIDDYIMEEIKKYPWINLSFEKNSQLPTVQEYLTILDEVNGVAIAILKLLENVLINQIYLVIPEDYKLIVKKTFAIFNIPINLDIAKNIYGMESVLEFLDNLKKGFTLEEALNSLEKDEVYNAIINICNKYMFTSLDDTVIYLIEEEIKNTTLKSAKLKNAINLANISDIDNKNYFFVLGFNEGVIPAIYKNDDFFSDKKKQELKILTSLEKNQISKLIVQEKIKSKKVFISYKLQNGNEEYYPSTLIREMNLPVVKNLHLNYNYSHLYNKLMLAKKLDDFIKFNTYDEDLDLLFNNYPEIPYLTYDNKYQLIDENTFKKFVKKITLAYTSIDNFYRCSFRYYLNYILQVNKYDIEFNTLVGNLFHFFLTKAFQNNFDLEKEWNFFLKDKVFNAKEKFFLEKLKGEFKEAVQAIKKQNSLGTLNKTILEKKVDIKIDENTMFTGIIDKIMYEIDNDKTYFSIVDYKTGNVAVALDNLIYGLEMQLPIYLYLSDYLKFKNPIIIGFYLQKIVHPKLNFQKGKNYLEEKEKLYRLNGFSTNDETALVKMDQDYSNSQVVKSLKKSSKGFYNYAKILTEDEFQEIKNIVRENIIKAADKINKAEFSINPKKIGFDLKGCEFCEYQDICFKKEKDVVYLKSQSYQEFLKGGEENANLD